MMLGASADSILSGTLLLAPGSCCWLLLAVAWLQLLVRLLLSLRFSY